jgi:hypothetical protein
MQSNGEHRLRPDRLFALSAEGLFARRFFEFAERATCPHFAPAFFA